MVCLGDVYFWRQSVVLLSHCAHSIGTGFVLSLPAAMNPDILSPNGTGIRATREQASWIASSHGMAGVIGFCIVPFVMQLYGRKSVNVAFNIMVLTGSLIFTLAGSVSALFAGRIFQGFSLCGIYVSNITLAEYSQANRRGYFVTMKKFALAIGSLLSHSLAVFCTWKQIAAIAMIPDIISLIVTFMWVESPSFLAFQGRYDECEKSHIWLYGDSESSRKELEELIATQMERRKKAKRKIILSATFKKLSKKDFTRPFMIVCLLNVLIDACGRYYMLAYVVEILTGVTKDKSIATYCTIGSDLLTIVALTISCFVVRCCKRRTLLFTTGILSVFLMFLVSLMTFLKTRYGIGESFYWLTPYIILLNVFTVNVGVIPTCFAIASEIFPLEHKGTGTCFTGIVFCILYSLVLKFTPLMMKKTGIEGTFGIYGCHVFVALIILYFILIETKDKTLQEIENEIKGTKQAVNKPLMDTQC